MLRRVEAITSIFILQAFYFHNTSAVCPKDSEYPYSVFLDSNRHFEFSWRVDYRLEVAQFRVCVDKMKVSLLGVGFSNYGEITDSDFMVYWTNERGIHHFQLRIRRTRKYLQVKFRKYWPLKWIQTEDMYTDKKGFPHVDYKQDYFLENAETGGQELILEYWRKFDTCDSHDYLLDNGTTHVVYFASSEPIGSFPSSRVNTSGLLSGLQRIQLLKPTLKPLPLPEDTWTFEVTTPNIEVPATETTYWWYTVKLPPLKKKHHIIKYEGVIQPGHENIVHHMEVFHCEVPANEIVRFFSGPGLAEGKPPELESCRKVIGAWAMGASAMVLPEDAGFPLGGTDYSRYVLLEVHYNNPDMKAGMIDSSGIRFYVTSSLREYDAGIMELGLEYTNKMAIPPGQHTFRLTGYCIEECTKVSLPPEGIFIYASQLHTHLTGRRVYTKHVRNGVELPELNRDNHYSPHFQEIRRLPVPVKIMPGDALITTCEDRTLDRRNATVGGFAITDEMCVNYVHYYPATDLEVCKSSISTKALHNFFAFMKSWDLDNTSPSKGDRANYQSLRWTPLTTVLLKTLYMTSPISMQCNQSDGTRFPGKWEDVAFTKIDKPFKLPKRHCETNQ